MAVTPPNTFGVNVSLERIAKEAMAQLPSKEDQHRMVQGLGAAAMAFWKRQAQEKLRSTAREYVQGLSSESKDGKFIITLSGTLPNLVELGFKGGDMRQYMLNGPRAKRGKKGRYLIVPFQHGTPGTSGRNVGRPMPASIHEAAKQLAPTLSRPARGAGGKRTVRYGERLTETSRGVNAEASRLLTTKKKPWHASSVFRGMIREEKTFKKATQTTGYTTFRVLSENVNRGATDAQGKAIEHWFHPGIRAAHFAQKTQMHIKTIARGMLAAATKGGDKA